MNESRGIVISTHQVQDVEQLLDHVVILDNARVLLDASVTEICHKLYFTQTDNESETSEAYYSLLTTGTASCSRIRKTRIRKSTWNSFSTVPWHTRKPSAPCLMLKNKRIWNHSFSTGNASQPCFTQTGLSYVHAASSSSPQATCYSLSFSRCLASKYIRKTPPCYRPSQRTC